MSTWITGLADKAENILNKIDQNAATALQLPTEVPNSLDAMKKSFTSSTQSLKATLSPARKSKTLGQNSASSITSECIDIDTRNELKTLEQSMSNSANASFAIDISGAESPMVVNSINMDTQELAAFKIALNDITAERDELRIRLSALNHDVENMALQQRSQELQILAQRLAEERDTAQRECSEAQKANIAYVHSISELETNLAKLQQEYLCVAQKLKMQTKETDQQRTELHDYRAKAQRALQAKDTLIAKLKSPSNAEKIGADAEQSAIDNETRVLRIENDALKQEIQSALAEQSKLSLQLEQFIKLDKENTMELSRMQATVETLKRELRLAHEHGITIESEQRVRTQELHTLRRQLSEQLEISAARLQDKEQQMQKLRNEKLSISSNIDNNKSKETYEMRLKALTESLVERQSALENVTAERNALRIQFEQIQLQRYPNIVSGRDISGQRSNSGNALLSNSTDDVKAQFPTLMNPNPFDNRVARRVKRAYSTLDSFFFRSPLMRIFVLVYVAILHIWVMFVLLLTSPN